MQIKYRYFRHLVALLVGFAVLLAGLSSATAQEALPYLNPRLPVEQRVADLLSRMTLEEKIAQMDSVWENRQQFPDDSTALFVGTDGKFLPERAAVLLKNGIGEISRPSENRSPREMAEFTNSVQRWLKENTRLGIPALFHDECLHGHVAPRERRIRRPLRWRRRGIRRLCRTYSPRPPRKRGRVEHNIVWPRSWTWPAIRDGAAPRRPMAKTHIWFRRSDWPRSEDFRESGHWTALMS